MKKAEVKRNSNFNKMHEALRKIAKSYMNSEQIKKDSGPQFGLDYDEALEMAYDNIQNEARIAIKGIRKIKPKVKDNERSKNN